MGQIIFKEIDCQPKLVYNTLHIKFEDLKLITKDESMLRFASQYLNENFRLAISVDVTYGNFSDGYLVAYEALSDEDFSPLQLQRTEKMDGFNILETDLKNCGLNAVLLHFSSKSPFMGIRFLIDNDGDNEFEIVYDFNFSTEQDYFDLGMLVRNDKGWKFFPCQKTFV